jgi:hypothetical protein
MLKSISSIVFGLPLEESEPNTSLGCVSLKAGKRFNSAPSAVSSTMSRVPLVEILVVSFSAFGHQADPPPKSGLLQNRQLLPLQIGNSCLYSVTGIPNANDPSVREL